MIRLATYADIPQMVDLGSLMHKESRFSVLRYDCEKVANLVHHLISSDQCALVAEEDGVVVGLFIGMILPHWCSSDLVSMDMALFVNPEKRGGMTAAKLVKTYRQWAIDRGAKMVGIGVNTGVHAEVTGKLYERIGFKMIGQLYEGI